MKPVAAEVYSNGSGTTVVALMSQAEAQSAWDQVCHHFETGRVILLDFYEREGWRALGYKSWREFAVEKSNQSQSYLYRQIEAAQVEREISPNGELGVIPERQLRELARAPEGQRKPVYDEAAATAPNGKPTAKLLRETVDRVAPPPWPTPAPKLDPEYVDDAFAEFEKPAEPAWVARERRNGTIPEDAKVTITEPDPLDEDEPPNIQADPTDEEWLATLPARSGLSDVCRKIFDRDALFFRAITPHRLKFRHHIKPLINANSNAGKTGAYHFQVTLYLRRNDPKGWVVCRDCKGTGEVLMIGECPCCHGEGYKTS